MNAKLLAILAVLSASALPGCRGDRERAVAAEQREAALKRQLAAVEQNAAVKDRYIAEVTRTLVEIQQRLAPLHAGELSLSQKARDFEHQPTRPESQRKLLLADAERLAKELQSARVGLDALRTQLATSGAHVTHLHDLVETLRKRVVSDQARLAVMQKDLTHMSRRVNQLQVQVAERTKAIGEQRVVIDEQAAQLSNQDVKLEELADDMSRVYILIDTLEGLKADGVLQFSRGGFLGLRRRKSLTWKFPAEKLREHDSRNPTVVFDYPAERLEILTPHDSNSFSIAPSGPRQTTITIKDPARFWALRYLVVGLR